MNYTLIILGIILVLVLYVLYRFMTDRQTMVSSKVYLADKPGNKSFGELSNPESSRYSYNLWIYVVSLESDQNIFTIDDGAENYYFNLKFPYTLLFLCYVTIKGKRQILKIIVYLYF